MSRLGALVLVIAACGFPRPARVHGDGGGDGQSSCTTCQLLAVEPAIANTNDTITLEGTFDGNAGDPITVNFPGGMAQTGTLLGPHRATVVVPGQATAGDLTVEIGGGPIGPVPFRRASFVLGLEPFLPGDQATGARLDPVPATVRTQEQVVATGSYLYILGGMIAGAQVTSIEVARIDGDGSLGPFATAGTSLLTPRSEFTTDVIGKYVYVVGGQNNTGNLDRVERAPIASDGSLGGFEAAGVLTATPRAGHTTAVIGNNLYVFGGYGGGPDSHSVESATIQPDGTLGVFGIVSGVSTATARVGHGGVVIGNHVYLIGGSDPDSMAVLGSVESAPIQPDGTLGTFATVSGVSLNTARFDFVTRVLGGYVYVIGGFNGNVNLGTVERAAIGADGTLGNFSVVSGTSLLATRSGMPSAVVGNFLYLFGSVPPNLPNQIERASIEGGGLASNFATSTTTLAVGRGAATAATIGGYVYVFGGSDLTNMPLGTIERAPLAADGTVGTFAVYSGGSLSTPRSNHKTAVLGPYVYMIGGDGPSGPISNVESAPIHNDGSLGIFADTGHPLLYSLDWHVTAATAQYLYVMGGRPSGGTLTEIEYAPIHADGTIGSFSAATAVLATGRYYPTIAVIGNYMYLIGGQDPTNSSTLATVERATINSDGTLTNFAVLSGITLQTARMQASSAVVGDYLYVFSGYGTGALKSVERAQINSDGTISTFATVTGVALSQIRLSAPVAVSGNNLYILGSNDGGASRDIDQSLLQ